MEFAAYYDSQILLAMWQEAEVLNSAEQPANTDGASIPEGHDVGLSREEPAAAAGPVDTIANRPEDNVEQPASEVCLTTHASQDAHSSQDDELAAAAQPVDTIAGGPEDSDEQPVSIVCLTIREVQDVRLSWDQLARIKQEKNCGGKAANAKQKRLRQHCFANGLWEIDLTDSTYNWKQLLKAMPEAKSTLLVGPGVVKFSFRLLQTVRDHNYIKIDSGEKHVFEIECVDGLRWQLHFHKNGNMDDPDRIPPPCSMPQAVLRDQPMNETLGSAAWPAHEESPTWHLHDILDSTSGDAVPVGRAEVHMALTNILQSYSPQEFPFAVNITATTAFPWHRWLRNVVSNRELVVSGIVKVFALCETSIQDTQVVFCHPDDTYTRVRPVRGLEYERLNGWTDCPTFLLAPVETVSWLQTRTPQR